LSPGLFYVKNAFAVASAPLEVLISLLYWGLRAIDPKLVVPPTAPPLAPIADFGFHVVPSAAVVVDILFFSPPWTINVLPSIGISGGIALVYWFWVEECNKRNGFYPYPLFDQAGHGGRVGLFTMSAVILTAAIIGLRLSHGVVNGSEVPGHVKKA